MIEYYVPKQTSKLVTVSRWAVGWGLPILMLSHLFEFSFWRHWWGMLLLIPAAVACHWLATEGINRLLVRTPWGRRYLHRQFLWAAAQREFLKSKGESGDNVYLDSGDFAASFVVAMALLISALGVISLLFGDA
jgi:hypothetical protein